MSQPRKIAVHLRWFNDGLARGEAALMTFTLRAMVVLGAWKAVLGNLSIWSSPDGPGEVSGFHGSVQSLIVTFDWVDTFLQAGTLWLAFLGASLATNTGKHLGIDVLPRLIPVRPRQLLLAVVGLLTAMVTFYLGWVFFAEVLALGHEGQEYLVFADDGSRVHMCDAPDALLASMDQTKPTLACAGRSFFGMLGLGFEEPSAMLYLIVPIMFMWMGVRFTVRASAVAYRFATGEAEPAEEEAEEVASDDATEDADAGDSNDASGDEGSDD